MRKTAVWAAFIVACGSIGLAQGGAQAPAGGGGRGRGRRRPDGHPGAGAQGPFDRHSQGEAGAAPEGHGCEEAPDASHDRGRQVQREHPAHHRCRDGAGAPDHCGPVGRARGRRHADDGWRAREGQDHRRAEPADQDGRRRLHPLGAAPRRERRRQKHHVAQRAVGYGLAARFSDGRGHAERPSRPAVVRARAVGL